MWIRKVVSEDKQRGHQPAAFFFDTYFCADGRYTPTPGFLDAAIAAIRGAGALIVADEAQAGLSRSGTHTWAVQCLGIEPDLMVLGKPMGNGRPIGAAIARRKIVDEFYSRDRYFNTFAGNPVSTAVGVTVIDAVQKEMA